MRNKRIETLMQTPVGLLRLEMDNVGRICASIGKVECPAFGTMSCILHVDSSNNVSTAPYSGITVRVSSVTPAYNAVFSRIIKEAATKWVKTPRVTTFLKCLRIARRRQSVVQDRQMLRNLRAQIVRIKARLKEKTGK